MLNIYTIGILISLILSMMAGYYDVTGQYGFGTVSKEHLWHDAMYILLLLIAIRTLSDANCINFVF